MKTLKELLEIRLRILKNQLSQFRDREDDYGRGYCAGLKDAIAQLEDLKLEVEHGCYLAVSELEK